VLRFQVFFRVLSLWALLLAPELASARTLVDAETRVGVFEVASELCIRVSGLANSNGHQGNVDASTEEASRYPHAARGAGKLSQQAQKTSSSLNKRLEEHRQKLQDYIKNPDAFDNKGFLRNAPSQEVRERIIQGRIRHLENEIQNFEKQIADLLDGGG
jgi:predicted outer membrane protein